MTSVPVLMYHHVRPDGGFIACTPENFESQLQWLKRHHYQSLTLSQLADHLQGKNPAPKKSVVITFDDGYLNNWIYAYPLLKKYGFTATIFLVTSWLNNGEIRPNTTDTTTSLPACPDHAACEQLIANDQSDQVILRWSEVHAMQQNGVIEFHSHTHTHTRWDLIDPANKNQHIQQELELSKQALITQLGHVSTHLCWPQGYFDDDYIAIAQQLGFEFLYTTKAFGRNTARTPATRIHRFAVRNRSGQHLGKRIRASHHPIIGPIFNTTKRLTRALKART